MDTAFLSRVVDLFSNLPKEQIVQLVELMDSYAANKHEESFKDGMRITDDVEQLAIAHSCQTFYRLPRIEGQTILQILESYKQDSAPVLIQ